MAIVLVTGGTGTLGRGVVSRLREQGHEVRVLSRRPGAGTHEGDLTTGAGVAAAAEGAELVVHAASDTHRMGGADVDQTRHLLDATRGAGHLLYVSIVGIDRIPFLYYRRKLACEGLLASARVPYTILRATQFHELIAILLQTAGRLPLSPLPLDFRFQTIAADEVAARVVQVLGGPPQARADDVGGPEVLTLREMAEAWKAARGGPRRLVPLRIPGRVAQAFREGWNTCPDHADGRQTWAQYLAGRTP
jgi:uncharacterized protein YbjT (DUF2867 family)